MMCFGDKQENYGRLRAAYDAAFRRLVETTRRKECERKAVDEAFEEYRRRRNDLANYLLPLEQTAHVSTIGQQADLESLAHQLWLEAGCPMGNPDEHWFRAEELLRNLRPG